MTELTDAEKALKDCPLCGDGYVGFKYDDHMWEDHPNDRADEWVIDCDCGVVFSGGMLRSGNNQGME